MALTLADLDLDATLRPILAAYAETMSAWRRNEAGAWGALAAQAVLAARQALGRSLTDAERRIVWQAMWALLNEG